jgi:hypothetical protein
MNKDGLGWRSTAGGRSVTVVGSELTKSKWIRIGLIFQLRLETKTGTSYKFDGFAEKVRLFRAQRLLDLTRPELTPFPPSVGCRKLERVHQSEL